MRTERFARRIVIVDNNSNPPLHEMRCVREFLRNCSNAHIVREEAQGLTFARLAGIRATSSPVIVVFDDDNVPCPNYLQVVSRLIQEYPFVGVWGPGNVDVELLDPVPASLQRRVKAHHGQKSSQSVQYALVPSAWYHFYPIGMGQVIREKWPRAIGARWSPVSSAPPTGAVAAFRAPATARSSGRRSISGWQPGPIPI